MDAVPDDLRYTKTHEWVRITGKTAVIGITDYAQKELHEIVYVELPDLGKLIQKGAEIAAVESVKARSEIFSPLSGKVLRVNGELVEGSAPAKPELLNEDPYGRGWLLEIQLTGGEEAKDLLSAEDYQKLTSAL